VNITDRTRVLPTPDQLRELITGILDDHKAEDIVVIDLKGKSSIADFMVIATGRSNRQVAAMADHIVQRLKELGIKGITPEGLRQRDWVLIDAGDVIVHLFRPEVRSFYNLEKMWGAELPEPDRAAAP
jgi:ribosome-associated protein